MNKQYLVSRKYLAVAKLVRFYARSMTHVLCVPVRYATEAMRDMKVRICALFHGSNMRRHFRVNAHSRAFTLLMAMLVVSVVLSMGSSIYALVSKQIALVGVTRDSRYAFYAADSSAECALYWDERYNLFATTTPTLTPTCNGVNLSFVAGDTNLPLGLTPPAQTSAWPLSGATYPYVVEYNYDYQYVVNSVTYDNCADVFVWKDLVGGVINSTIHADGYSVPCAARTTSPRSLQRSVEIQY